MKREKYNLIKSYMEKSMNDSAHDKEHVYRVLYLALDIADHEKNVNKDILIIACLLHDIGREKQFKNPKICHAQIGSEMAYKFCMENGFSDLESKHIKKCISTHRFRGDNKPESIEAKILFDADKLDVTGTIGIARTLFYKGIIGEPLYYTDENGNILNGENEDGKKKSSFFKEYNYKLKNIYNKFYTARATEIAKERQKSAALFYEEMLAELTDTYKNGKLYLNDIVE